MPTKAQLEEANQLLQVKVKTATGRGDALMTLLISQADYLKEIEVQLLSIASSVRRALESHATLSAPIPKRKVAPDAKI
jgi:hypothetical protein